MASSRKFSEEAADLKNESRQQRQKAILLQYQSSNLCESSSRLLAETRKFAPKSAIEKGAPRGGRPKKAS